MKTKLIVMIFCCVLASMTQVVFADQYEPASTDADSERCQQHPLVEAKVGYFFFTDSTMRHVYDKGGVDVQISGSYPVYKILHVYGSVEYLQKSGHSINGHQRTSLWEIPLSLGLRTVFPIRDNMEYYLTLGPRYFFVHVHNHSSYVPKNMHANGCGGFANTGFLFIVGEHFTIDLFGEYSYKRLHFHSGTPGTQGHTVQVGGLTFGGGVGYSF